MYLREPSQGGGRSVLFRIGRHYEVILLLRHEIKRRNLAGNDSGRAGR